MAISNDAIVYRIEKAHGVQAIESKKKNLFYLQDDDKSHIGILTVDHGVPEWQIYTKEQFKKFVDLFKGIDVGKLRSLASEMNDVYDIVFN